MSRNVSLDIKQLPDLLEKIVKTLQKRAVIIFLVSVLGLYSFLIFQVNTLSSAEPDDSQINEQADLIKRPQIDQASIEKIEKLQDQNVAVKSLFKSARENPFLDN